MSNPKPLKNQPSIADLSRMEIATEVSASAHQHGAWQVEAAPAGEPLVTSFVGPHAKDREYAYAKFAAVLG